MTAATDAELGLGEVDDAVGPVHEDQTHAEQAVEQADERAVDEDVRGAWRADWSPMSSGPSCDPAEDELGHALDDDDVQEHDLDRRPAMR